MGSKKIMAMVVAVIMLMVCMLPMAGYESDARESMFVDDVDQQKSVPPGYDHGIYTPEDLAKIGVDPDWGLDKKYILMNNIDLAGKDLTAGGFDVTVTSTTSVPNVTFNVKDGNGPLAGVTVWFNGASGTTDASGNVTFNTYSNSRDYVVGVSGTDIAFSFELARGTLANITKNSNGNFSPIGLASAAPFSGEFNGNGYVISGAEVGISEPSDATSGLFHEVTGKIENLGVTDSTITCIGVDDAVAGGIAGDVSTSDLTNCFFKGNVHAFGNKAYSGGIAGKNASGITKSFTNGTISAIGTTEATSGGIVGVAGAVVSLCYSLSKVSAQSDVVKAGGIAGYATANIERSFNNGAINAPGASEAYAGGVVGDSTVQVLNSYNTGNVISSVSSGTGKAYTGGVAGRVDTIKMSYSVSATLEANAAENNSSIGGVAAVPVSSGSKELDSCYFLKINDTIEIVADDTAWTTITDSDVKEKSQLQNIGTFVRWNFTTTPETWGIGVKYRTMTETETPNVVNNGYPVISGLIPNEIYIEDMEDQLAVKGDEVTFTVKASSDIPITSYTWQRSTDGSSWSTTGDTSQSLTVTATSSSVWYRCIVRNGVATALYADAELVVYNGEVSTLNDLKNVAMKLDGKYIQKADLTFDEKTDLNGGHTMNVTTVLNGTQLTVTVKYDTTFEAAGVYIVYDDQIWVTNAQGIATLTYNASASKTIVIGGVISTADTFVISFELGADGNTEVEKNSNGNFSPIGTSIPFSGEYNGNGYKIYGLETAVYSEDTVNGVQAISGLFANVTGTVKNVAIESGSSTAMAVNPGSGLGEAIAGGVVGHLDGGTVTGCYNKGAVNAMAFFNGAGNVSSSAGGVIGKADGGSVSKAFNTGNIYSRTIGAAAVTIAGGVAGATTGATVSDCYSTGTLTTAGAAAGVSSGGVVGVGNGITISNSYSTGTQNVPASVVRGGIIGSSNGGNAYNCYFLNTSADQIVATGTVTLDGNENRTDGTQSGGKTSEALRNKSTYYTGTTGSIVGWDFDSSDPTWIMTGDGPVLKEVKPADDGGDGGLEWWIIAVIVIAIIAVLLAAFLLYRRRKA